MTKTEQNKCQKIARDIWKEAEEENKINAEISYRGGGIGIMAGWLSGRLADKDLIKHDDIDYIKARLPRYVGAGCNYLGGGIRGSICMSGMDESIWENFKKAAEVLTQVQKIAVEKYKNEEQELGLYDESWEAKGTAMSRARGIVSAY